MGSAGSKNFEPFIKLVGNDPVDDIYLEKLKETLREQHNAEEKKDTNNDDDDDDEVQKLLETDYEDEVPCNEITQEEENTFLSLNYSCILKEEFSNQLEIRKIVLFASEFNKINGISGELKLRDSLSRNFEVEQVRSLVVKRSMF